LASAAVPVRASPRHSRIGPGAKALPPDLLPLDVVDWFLLPEPELQIEGDAAPMSPREWLLSGRPTDIVVRLAGDLTRA
jgi:hypothetical protein